MARIRNIKPEFFEHEELQDMEIEHPELHPMLVFSALWTQCEWSGVFHWSIRKLSLKILPFLKFDLEKTLELLMDYGYITKFSRDGKDYGYVYNFTKYQAISGNEKGQELKYPTPNESELKKDYSGTRPIQSQYSPETIVGLDSDCTESPDIDSDSDSDIGHRTKDIGHRTYSVTVTPNVSGENDPKTLFLHIWQHTPDIFNALARIESPKEWERFWKTGSPTCEQVKIAMDNFIADVREGRIEHRFVPSKPDRFVLNGWIVKCQKRFKPEKTGPQPSKHQQNKKSL